MSALDKRDFVKIICAAGNEDPLVVHNISMLYAAAGADCIDVAANPKIVEAAKKGIEKGLAMAGRNETARQPPMLCVSVGLEGDQHVRKARVTELGKNCIELTRVCPSRAITGGKDGEPVRVITESCIGCGKCEAVKEGAIEFYSPKHDLGAILPECKAAGADMFELHANSGTDEEVLTAWNAINAITPDGFISICLGRGRLSDQQLTERVGKVQAISGKRTMVQADGVPMTGLSDSVNGTLQAVATGDIVLKMKNPPIVILSGGTNDKTAELAGMAGVPINGVSFGSNARRRVYRFITLEGLESKTAELGEAIGFAAGFVGKVKDDLRKAAAPQAATE
ncbi:MAG: ferredoxin family protein [Candidatus Micrarchaeia archaeon]